MTIKDKVAAAERISRTIADHEKVVHVYKERIRKLREELVALMPQGKPVLVPLKTVLIPRRAQGTLLKDLKRCSHIGRVDGVIQRCKNKAVQGRPRCHAHIPPPRPDPEPDTGAPEECPTCHGNGTDSDEETCKGCFGTGRI